MRDDEVPIRLVLTLVVALYALALGLWLVYDAGAAVPPRADQPHPDQFQYQGQSLASFNPLNQRALATKAAAYRLLTMPGCNTGTVPQAMQRVSDDLQKVKFSLTRNDTSFDFTVRINCGSEQIRICGAVTIFCLGRGFPQVGDIEISDILSTYTQESQLSIPLHEVLHGIATFGEQYCTGDEPSGPCQGLARFTPAPNWPDVMNTGLSSRHGIQDIEKERWERVMYTLEEPAPPTPEYNSCTTYPGWEPTVSCFWPKYNAWLWTIPLNGHDSLWEWSVTKPVWTCTNGCPK